MTRASNATTMATSFSDDDNDDNSGSAIPKSLSIRVDRSHTTSDEERYLSNIEYLRYLRDSYPQTRYFLRQWDSLYREYECEVCPSAMSKMCGSSVTSDKSPLERVRYVNDLSRTCKNGRYTACVNLAYSRVVAIDCARNARYRVHVCNFLPIVIGTQLDLSLRKQGGGDLTLAARLDSSLLGRMGQVFVFDNFWVFSAFISTDARQCHKYRERTKSANCSVRMYVYDKTGKGHMLFIRPNDRALFVRDKLRREVCLIDSAGAYALNDSANDNGDDDHHVDDDVLATTRAVVNDFVRDVFVIPFDSMAPRDFFFNCRTYMLYGVGDVAVTDDRRTLQPTKILGFRERDIDHLDNKRVSSAPSLYAALLRSFARNVSDAIDAAVAAAADDDSVNVVVATAIEPMLRTSVTRYATMSQRANLLPFISRKTHIRQDWCESMKRQMKSEIRSNRRSRGTVGGGGNGCNNIGGIIANGSGITAVGNGNNFVTMYTVAVTSSSSSSFVAAETSVSTNNDDNVGCAAGGRGVNENHRCDESSRLTENENNATDITRMNNEIAAATTMNVVTFNVIAPDIAQDNTKVSQQFYCSKVHLDVEYDHEIVKRMRVVNLNAMTCLRMPIGFERFLSYYNVGNIGNAGRVMTRTHGMRDSYIPCLETTIKRIVEWIQEYFGANGGDERNRCHHRYNDEKEYTNRVDESVSTTRKTTRSNYSGEDFTLFTVNEIPILRIGRVFAELLDDECSRYLRANAFSLWRFVLALKFSQPGCVVTITHLYGYSYCANVRVAHSVPLCPVNLLDVRRGEACDHAISDFRASNLSSEKYARFCRACAEYRTSACLTLPFDSYVVPSAWRLRMRERDTMSTVAAAVLPVCSRHAWFSRHELSLYYQTFECVREQRPLMHEIACHGFLSVGCYPLSTDISKLIVSINAHRRSLDITHRSSSSVGWARDRDDNDDVTATQQQQLIRIAWARYGDCNGKFTRLVLPSYTDNADVDFLLGDNKDDRNNGRRCIDTGDDDAILRVTHRRHALSVERRLSPKNAVKLMFAFGDNDMLNCEDGYVLDQNLPLFAETLFRKKITFSYKCTSNNSDSSSSTAASTFSFVSRMVVNFNLDQGMRLHVGTLYSRVRVNVPCGNDVLVYHRDAIRATWTTSVNDMGNNNLLYACDIYLVWNASFMQARPSACGTYRAVRVIRERYGEREERNVQSQQRQQSQQQQQQQRQRSFRYRHRNGVGGDDGCCDETVSAATNLSTKNECLLYEEHRYDEAGECQVAAASVEVFDRFLRVSVLGRPGRQTLKLQNSFGQKGVAHFADLSDLVTDRGETVDVISSMYSLVGRSACGQMLEQRTEGPRKIFSRSTGRCLGTGGYGYFFVSSDSAHNHFIYHTKHGGSNPMRMCKLTYEALLENCASSTAFVKGSDFESATSNPYAGMPRTVNNALGCYGVHQRALTLESQRTMTLRKRVHDVALLQRLVASAEERASSSQQRQESRSSTKRRRRDEKPFVTV